MQGVRIARLANQLREEIAMIIHQELKDPRLGFLTITKVQLSKDLSQAKVSFSCFGSDEERQSSQTALEKASGFIHGLIRKRLRLKIIPTIIFVYDPSVQGTIAMDEMLDNLKREWTDE